MSRAHSHLNSASTILRSYQGTIPFAHFLKKYFSDKSKYGSKDRKFIARICYAFFRLGKSMPSKTLEERLLSAYFLCAEDPATDYFLQTLKPDWTGSNENIDAIKRTLLSEVEGQLFPWAESLSNGIDAIAFERSHLVQPSLFLRIRKGQDAYVLHRLESEGIFFQRLGGDALALQNGTKLDACHFTEKHVVVQDFSSQQIGTLMQQVPLGPSSIKVWDCCAASGGKSILASDIFSKIDLTVSDNRPSILINLHKRFRDAGIRQYHAFEADLSLPIHRTPAYDFIIADVPCTGSGTWGRTPEQLYYFDYSSIAAMATLQRKILDQVQASLNKGGYLLFSTCSVFREENEAQVEYLVKQHGLILDEERVIKGYTQKADSMFAALLRKL